MIDKESRGDVTLLRLAHGKANAFDTELLEALAIELTALLHAETTAVVLTGTGHIFSAGVDLRRLSGGGRAYVDRFLPALGDAFFKAFAFPKPLVAAINGHAIAGGCILACACDYRVMADGEGRIGVPELAVGVPLPSMALEILRLAVPVNRLQALIYEGKICTPLEALREGFVDELVPAEQLLDRAISIATRLGRIPAASFTLTKRLVRQPTQDRVANNLKSIDEEVLEAWASPAVQEAVRSYTERTLKK